MKIWHETTPRQALTIMQYGEFWGNTIASDNGMNTYPLGGNEHLYMAGQAVNKGAKMIFEWNGPIVTTTTHNLVSWSAGTIFDEQFHRIFVPCGTDYGLTLIDIQLIGPGRWEDTLDVPIFPWFCLDIEKWKNYIQFKRIPDQWTKSQVANIKSKINTLGANPKPIKVIDATSRPAHN